MNSHFIMTSDLKTKDFFLQQGGVLLKEEDDIAVFLNCNELDFEGENLVFAFTNVLVF